MADDNTRANTDGNTDGLRESDNSNKLYNAGLAVVKEVSKTAERRTWRSGLGTALLTVGTTFATAGFGWNTLIAVVCSGVGGYLLWVDGTTKKNEDIEKKNKEVKEKNHKNINKYYDNIKENINE